MIQPIWTPYSNAKAFSNIVLISRRFSQVHKTSLNKTSHDSNIRFSNIAQERDQNSFCMIRHGHDCGMQVLDLLNPGAKRSNLPVR